MRTSNRRCMCIVPAACLLFILVGCSGGPRAQVIEMKVVESSTMDLGYGTCQWLRPKTSPGEKLLEEPTYVSAKPVHYAAVYGDSKDKTFTFVIDESAGTGKGYDTLYVDSNNDGRLDEKSERFALQMSTVRDERPVRLKIDVCSGGRTAPYWFSFTAFPYPEGTETIHANLRNGSYYAGEAMIDNQVRRIAVADLNSNGLFNDPEVEGIFRGDRIFVDLNGDGILKNDRDASGRTGFPYGRYTRIGEKWYSISAAPDGRRLTISEASPAMGRVEAPPMVSSVDLRSKSQQCYLDFSTGPAEAVAGTYQVRLIGIKAPDEDGRPWAAYGDFQDAPKPRVTVRKGRTLTLDAMGPPLHVEPVVTQAAEKGVLELSLCITGRAGERYRWPQSNARTSRPGIEVLDASGQKVLAVTLEYG